MTLLRDLMRDDVGREYADAHRYATEHGARPRRLGRLATGVACVGAAGILAAGLVQRSAGEPAAVAARAALAARAQAGEQRLAELETSISASRTALLDTQNRLLAQSSQGQSLVARLESLEGSAGYRAVSGPGVVVTLDDATGLDRTDPAAPGRVFDRDVQSAANALWQAGAEAIAINGRRLTSITAIRTAGEAILVDFKPLLPPYRLEAIGDPAGLRRGYSSAGSARQLAELADLYGLRIDVARADALHLPAATALLPVRAHVPGPGGVSVSASATAAGGRQ